MQMRPAAAILKRWLLGSSEFGGKVVACPPSTLFPPHHERCPMNDLRCDANKLTHTDIQTFFEQNRTNAAVKKTT
jgi:hypothetical protein